MFVEKLILIHVFSEIQLSEYEKEQMMNWEFQGAEYFVHKKKAEEKNTLEKRVWALGDRWVFIFQATVLFYVLAIPYIKFQFIDGAVHGEVTPV